MLPSWSFHHIAVAILGQSERLMWSGLSDPGDQAQRSGQGLAAEADIGQMRPAIEPVDAQEHVRAAELCALGHIPEDPRREPGDPEPQSLERAEQETILLKQ